MVKAVLIPRWAYRALLLVGFTAVLVWDYTLRNFVMRASGVESTMNITMIRNDVVLEVWG